MTDDRDGQALVMPAGKSYPNSMATAVRKRHRKHKSEKKGSASRSARKLYVTQGLDGTRTWIGEDQHGDLWSWPDEIKGYLKKTKYDGTRAELHRAPSVEARGTGWPGGVGGGRRRLGGSVKGVGKVIRAAPDLWAAAGARAKAEAINLNEYVRRALAERVDRTPIIGVG